MKKILLSIMLSLILIMVPYINTYASDDSGLGDLNQYKGSNAESDELKTKVSNLLGIIRNVGVVMSVVVLMILGIKYMLGSVEEKSEYKQSFKPYIIGAFILFTGSFLPNIIYLFAKNI